MVKVPKLALRYGGYVLSVGTARVVGVLISAATFPFLLRRLGVEMYGSWSYVLVICGFLDTVANPGLMSFVTQQVAARRLEAVQTVSDVLTLRLLTTLVAVAIILTVAAFDSNPTIRLLLRFYGVAIFLTNWIAADNLLGAMEMFHLRSLLAVTQQGLYAFGIFVFVRSSKDVIWLPISIVVSVFITNVWGWFGLWRAGFQPTLCLAPHRWKAIMVPSAHYGAATVTSTLYHRTGHLVVRWLLGEHALGLYAAAVRFVDILRQFITLVLGVLTPRIALSGQSEERLRRLTQLAVSIVALLSIPLMFGTLATARLVVPWVMGASYADCVPLVRWMAPFQVAAPAATLFSGTVLYALGRYRAYLISTTGGAIAAVVLYFTLTPWLGLKGASSAFVAGELAVALVAYALIPSALKDVWKNPTVVIATAGTIPMLLAIGLASSRISQPLLIVAIGSVVYLVSCAAMGGRRLWGELHLLS